MLVLEPDYHRFAINILELRLHFCHLVITTSRSTPHFGIMAWLTRSSQLTILALALTLSPIFNISVSAQPSGSSSAPLGSLLENSFKPPSRGLPDNRQGGATRGGPCFEKGNPPLTALVPITGGETAAEYPTVFWYMPKLSDNNGAAPAPELVFTLKNANGDQIYSTQYPLTKYADGSVGTPGVMSLALAKPLQVGQEYKWEIIVKCDAIGSDRSEDQFAVGYLKRVAEDPSLESRVQQASAEDRVIIYAQANRWYEMLANLVALRRDRPNDPTLTDAWNKLFAGVDLNTVTIQSRSQGVRNSNN